MAPTPLVLGAVYAQIVPAAALLAGRNRSRPALIVAGTFLFSLATDLLGRYVGHLTGNSLWVSLLAGACITVFLLMAFAEWQTSSLERLAFRIATLPFLAAFGTLVFLADGIATFPRFSYPLGILVVLGGALWTLLRRTYAPSETPLIRTDWFLILVGIALNASATLVTSPIAAVLMARQRVDLFVRVWEVRGAFVIVALVLIAMGTFRPSSDMEAVV